MKVGSTKTLIKLSTHVETVTPGYTSCVTPRARKMLDEWCSCLRWAFRATTLQTKQKGRKANELYDILFTHPRSKWAVVTSASKFGKQLSIPGQSVPSRTNKNQKFRNRCARLSAIRKCPLKILTSGCVYIRSHIFTVFPF